MSLVPWKSKNNGGRSLTEMDQTTDPFFRLLNLPLMRWSEGIDDVWQGNWAPAIDVVEDQNNYIIKADIPGLNKDDLNVTIDDNTLSIRGEKRTEKETKEEGYIRQERGFGSFHRSFRLPHRVNSSKVNATYKNGVLELTVPKEETAKAKKINVEIE